MSKQAIVRYLDDAEQHIRAYVSAKERLIALLEEERQAVIHQAVTRGLDPNVKLKPSGVEWLSDAPDHWDVCCSLSASIQEILRGKFTHRPRNDPSLYDGPPTSIHLRNGLTFSGDLINVDALGILSRHFKRRRVSRDIARSGPATYSCVRAEKWAEALFGLEN